MRHTTMKAKTIFPKQRQQQGVVLAIALIMLVLITLLAVSGMRSTIMEERMVSNSRNNNTAFQLAESALRQAELALEAAAIANNQLIEGPLNVYEAETNNNVPGIACVVTLDSLDFNLAATWPGASCDITGSTIAELNTRLLPHYYIEFVFAESTTILGAGGVPVRDCYYRITSRGYGADANSFVTLQTTYKFDICS